METQFPSGRQIFNLYDKDWLSRVVTPEGDIVLNYLCATNLGSMRADSICKCTTAGFVKDFLGCPVAKTFSWAAVEPLNRPGKFAL